VFVLRIEDIDQPRVVAGAAEALLSDLRWLGIDWDEGPDCGGPFGPYLQSQRLDRYARAVASLCASGHAYRCSCSRKEIAEIASAPHGDDGPIYPGTCRDRPAHPEREAALRFRMPEPPPTFDDLLHGAAEPDLGRGDFIIQRRDGVISYQLACAVDDAAMQITEVVRGDDLLASTPRQIALYRALGLDPPRFAHVPLVLGPDGERLAKRHGSIAIAELRAAGFSAEPIVGRLAFSAGLVDRARPIAAAELIGSFDVACVSRVPAVV
jgi:glutamyl-tRNA synthetase